MGQGARVPRRVRVDDDDVIVPQFVFREVALDFINQPGVLLSLVAKLLEDDEIVDR